jgi:hypothetical protein
MAQSVVYFTPKGKTYHTNQHCMALGRATVTYQAGVAEAVQHGLKPCAICNRAKSTKTGRSNDWAKK